MANSVCVFCLRVCSEWGVLAEFDTIFCLWKKKIRDARNSKSARKQSLGVFCFECDTGQSVPSRRDISLMLFARKRHNTIRSNFASKFISHLADRWRHKSHAHTERNSFNIGLDYQFSVSKLSQNSAASPRGPPGGVPLEWTVLYLGTCEASRFDSYWWSDSKFSNRPCC